MLFYQSVIYDLCNQLIDVDVFGNSALGVELITKLFVEKKETIKIICPDCKCSRIVDVSEYKNLAKAVKVRIKCKCGYAHVALLERRDRFRKPTKLKGSYLPNLVVTKIDRKEIEVINLSANGIRFKFVDNSKYKFRQGDKLLVEFSLNEMPNSLFRKEVIIKSFKEPFISAEFEDKNFFNKDLCFKIFLYE
jgi:hypothetical protein